MTVDVTWGTLLGLAQQATDDPTVEHAIVLARLELERLHKLEEIAVRLSRDTLAFQGSISLLDAQQILKLAGKEVVEIPPLDTEDAE